MRKRLNTLICVLAVMGITTLVTPATLEPNLMGMITAEADTPETRAYIYEWAYKVIDGHVYKRLYNATLGEWVGDWILVE